MLLSPPSTKSQEPCKPRFPNCFTRLPSGSYRMLMPAKFLPTHMASLTKPGGTIPGAAPRLPGAKEVQKKLGHRIRALRGQKGWSQEQLAGESGLGRSSMGAIERGEASIRLANL